MVFAGKGNCFHVPLRLLPCFLLLFSLLQENAVFVLSCNTFSKRKSPPLFSAKVQARYLRWSGTRILKGNLLARLASTSPAQSEAVLKRDINFCQGSIGNYKGSAIHECTTLAKYARWFPNKHSFPGNGIYTHKFLVIFYSFPVKTKHRSARGQHVDARLCYGDFSLTLISGNDVKVVNKEIICVEEVA